MTATRRDEAVANYTTAMDKLGVPLPEDLAFRPVTGRYVDRDTADLMIVCRICKQSLNDFVTGDGDTETVTYIHARSWARYDHEPEPVEVTKDNAADQICDFCGGGTGLYWTFIGEPIMQGEHNGYNGTWGACETCYPIVKSGDLRTLSDRVMRVSPLAHGDDPRERAIVRNQMLSMWSTFLPTVRETRYIGPKRQPAKLHARMMPKLQAGLVKFWQMPTLLDLLQNGRRTSRTTHAVPGIHAGREDEFVMRYGPDDDAPPNVWKNHVDHLTAGIQTGDLFWISAQFTQLAIMAGKDFDKLIISREELPAPFGFMMFETPIGELPRPGGLAALRGVSWTLVPGGIWVNLYIQGEDADPDVDIEQMRRQMGYLLCPNPGSGLTFDTEIPRPDSREFDFISTILATWFLMTQPGVAEHTTAPIDKKLARSYQRENRRPLPDVKLVDLRRAPRRTTPKAEHEGREYTFRVYRKGHWKRQAYGPARSLRKTIYVSGYIAGPEGAPLKDRPTTVKVLR